jgi:hypothetical protein
MDHECVTQEDDLGVFAVENAGLGLWSFIWACLLVPYLPCLWCLVGVLLVSWCGVLVLVIWSVGICIWSLALRLWSYGLLVFG